MSALVCLPSDPFWPLDYGCPTQHKVLCWGCIPSHCRPCKLSLCLLPALGSGPSPSLLPLGMDGVKAVLEDVSFPQTQSHHIPLYLGAPLPEGPQCQGTGQSFLLYCTREHQSPTQPCSHVMYIGILQSPNDKGAGAQSMPHSQPGPFPPSGCTEPVLETPPCRVVSLGPSILLQHPEEGDALQGDGTDSSSACPSLP